MMKSSVGVISQSGFKAWTSSVEEAKSMGKPGILSRINVYVEQDSARRRYVDLDDAVGRSWIRAAAWTAPAASLEEAERTAREALHIRTVQFGAAYMDLARSVRPAHVASCRTEG